MLALALLVPLLLHYTRPDFFPFWHIETAIRDLYLRQQASDLPETRFSIVDIDEHSLHELGQWPWPRERLADLVEVLIANYGATIVGLDMVLPEPHAGSGDERLAILADHRLLVLAQVLDFTARTPPIKVGQVAQGWENNQTGLPAAQAHGYIGNHAKLARSPCVGNIGLLPDQDGQVRNLPLITHYQNHYYPSLSLALVTCAVGPSHSLPRASAISVEGEWQLPFTYSPRAYTSVPASMVMSLEAPDALLRGRIVLIGSSALGLGDRVATPLSGNMAGVIVHAESLSNLLDGSLITPPDETYVLWYAWMAGSIVLLWAAIAFGRSLWAPSLAGGIAILGWLLLTKQLTRTSGVLPMTPVLWGYALLLLVHMPAEWASTKKRARTALKLLSRYVSPPVMQELVNRNPDELLLPAMREITVLVADMQDYTKLTAISSLDAAANLTRDFLQQLTEPVLEEGGTLDKYTGDGLVAFWGAPIPVQGHADAAVCAALAILGRIRAFNESRMLNDLPPARVRIGIASGVALVGDLGTSFRSTYTAVGDCINIAARLQHMAKDLGVQVLISARTAHMCRIVPLHSLGSVPLRGIDMPLEVFTITGNE